MMWHLSAALSALAATNASDVNACSRRTKVVKMRVLLTPAAHGVSVLSIGAQISNLTGS